MEDPVGGRGCIKENEMDTVVLVIFAGIKYCVSAHFSDL